MNTNFRASAIALSLAVTSAGTANATENNSFYVEAFGGYAKGTFGAPDGTDTAGASFLGQTNNIDLSHNNLFGVRAGYEISSKWRVDLSYYDMQNDLNWSTFFPGCCTELFSADMDSQALLVSAYYSFNAEGKLSPYVGLGLGRSRNKLHNVVEFFGSSTPYAFPAEDTVHNFAYRAAIGADYSLSDQWKLNLDLSYINLGDASSGSTRSFASGVVQPIGKYTFDNIQRTLVTVGLKYSF